MEEITLTGWMNYVGFTDEEQKDKSLEKRFIELNNLWAERVNERLEQWNDEYTEAHPNEDCWTNEYNWYLFEKYSEVAYNINRLFADGRASASVIMIHDPMPENKEMMCAVFAMRMNSNPEKYMYVTYFPTE